MIVKNGLGEWCFKMEWIFFVILVQGKELKKVWRLNMSKKKIKGNTQKLAIIAMSDISLEDFKAIMDKYA